ncbi:Methylmalonyl-CoA epimerase [uncultured archaeon]|nr:Methylmalonyl-CoA epimerase [uncultured archaeon]
MFKRIDHIEIISRDIEKTIGFYTGILGFKIKQRQKVGVPPLEEIVYIELNGSVIELMQVKNPASAPQNPWQSGYRMIALEVEDMDKAVNYLKTKGVEITWGPVTLGKSKRAEIKDPDGLSIELRQW